MPFASMSNVTSICGRPRGAGGMSVRLNWPSDLLPPAMSRSPCRTWIVTAPWLSSAVENTCCALVGIVVFLLMSLVITPPSVSMPSESGVTSSSSTSFTSPFSTPAWMAARLAAEDLAHRIDHLRHARLAADQDHVVDLGDLDARVLDRDAARLHGFLDQLVHQRLELGPRDLHRKVLGPRLIRRDVGQVDFRLLRGRELDL